MKDTERIYFCCVFINCKWCKKKKRENLAFFTYLVIKYCRLVWFWICEMEFYSFTLRCYFVNERIIYLNNLFSLFGGFIWLDFIHSWVLPVGFSFLYMHSVNKKWFDKHILCQCKISHIQSKLIFYCRYIETLMKIVYDFPYSLTFLIEFGWF